MQITIERAIEILQQGGCVVLPTETVYGIFTSVKYGDPQQIYHIKSRDKNKPLATYMNDLPDWMSIYPHIKKYLPGPITVVYNRESFRFSNNITLMTIIDSVGPLFGTSANISGQPSISTGSAINIDAPIVNTGICTYGFETTVFDIINNQVLRPGVIPIHSNNIYLYKSENLAGTFIRKKTIFNHLMKQISTNQGRMHSFWYLVNTFGILGLDCISGNDYYTLLLNNKINELVLS